MEQPIDTTEARILGLVVAGLLAIAFIAGGLA
jgi:hypothetical protein